MTRLSQHKTYHARYVGPDQGLRGFGALVRPHSTRRRVLMAQLDRVGAFWRGVEGDLGLGWHPFKRRDWRVRASKARSDSHHRKLCKQWQRKFAALQARIDVCERWDTPQDRAIQHYCPQTWKEIQEERHAKTQKPIRY